MNAFGLSSLLTTLCSIGLGLSVYFKNPRQKLNQLWLILSVSITLWGVGGLAISILQEPSAALRTWRWTAILGISWIPVFFYQFICELCGLSRPKIILTHYAIASASCILYATTDLLFKGTRYVFGEFYWNEIGPLHPFYLAWWSGTVLYAHLEVWRAFRRNSGILKSQFKWTMIAFVVGFSFGILGFLPNYHIDLYPWGNFAIPLYPVIMAYGIFRYQLFDISLVIRKSMVYSILVTLLTAGYFALVYGVERFFQITFGYQSRWLSLTAFALMALLFQPLKIGIQRFVDWLIFRVPQEELARHIERLEREARETEKLRAVATMASGLCHELRNPLQIIQTHAEVLPERYDEPGFRQQCTQTLCTETKRINDLLKELMEFAKPKPAKLRPVEPHLILDSTLNLLNADLLKHKISLERQYSADGARILADPNQVRQVVLNLVLNAMQAIGQEGGITVRTHQDGVWFVLEVQDTGPGISPKILSKLFQPFTTTKADGNGLGLSVAHSIIQSHRGRISAESKPGEGTCFTVKLPLD